MNTTRPRTLHIAAAQSPSIDGDTAHNLRTHLAFIEVAAAKGVRLLVFPELSLTGYSPAALAAHHFHAAHPDLMRLQRAAQPHGLTLVVGAPAEPLERGALPAIGAWILGADGSVQLYRKRHLHGGEQAFASAGDQDTMVLPLAGEPTGLAVCADATHEEHAKAARAAGAALYASGAVISEAGYGPESRQLAGYAREHGMAVLLANHGGPTGGYVSAGRSAFWAPGGLLVAQAPGPGAWLVDAQRTADGLWSGEALAMELAA